MSDPQKILKKCRTMAEKGQIDSLINTLNDAIKNHPTNAEFTAMRAKIMIQMNRIDHARSDLEKTISLNPFNSEAFDNLGVIEQMTGNYVRASELHLAALNTQPNNVGVLFNLAVALESLGQAKQSHDLYLGILELEPTHRKAMVNLAVYHEKNNENDLALSFYKKSLEVDPESFESYMGLGNLYRKMGNREKAKPYYQKAVELRPDHGAAQFMLANIKGETPENAPTEYVATLFDDFADSFEDKLIRELEYRAPDLLYEGIKKHLKNLKTEHKSLKAIDLGAGTGLFGKMIRDDIALSIGVDLSQKMLDKAQERQIYDEIICNDLVMALSEQHDNSCHLISAADVFVYVGDLDAVFEQAHRALHPDGLFTFTVEILNEGETHNFILLDTARYAHNANYIAALAEKYGFLVDKDTKTWLRMNKNVPINGAIYVMIKK